MYIACKKKKRTQNIENIVFVLYFDLYTKIFDSISDF